jgi:hypothetical protein
MINWLQKYGNYTSNGNYLIIPGLTVKEKKELEQLRLDIKQYRELEENNEGARSDVTKSVLVV